jgi:hypothetical protein
VALAVTWSLLCLRWFDAAREYRPRAMESLPAPLFALAFAAACAGWASSRWRVRPVRPFAADGGLLLVIALAVLFRLPMAWQGAAAYVTPDGALSGLMALDVRDGRAHDVFVPHVPYSGSLKAHLTAPLAALVDPARAFALVSVLFYAAFVAGVYRLAAATAPGIAVAAGLYAAFSPAYVTRYSLSNDGNYVEVLALGTWALVLALRWAEDASGRAGRAVAIGALIGLAFWCHILAVIPGAAIALFLLAESPRDALRTAPAGALGFVLGDLPGLLWNVGNGGESFAYLAPGAVAGGSGSEMGLLGKGARVLTDHLVVLAGYDFGYPWWVDGGLRAVSILTLIAAGAGIVRATTRAPESRSWRLILIFAAANVALALFALPYIPGNPRYLLFLTAVIPILLAATLRSRAGVAVLAAIVATGALASLAQAVGATAADAQWRAFVRALEEEGVRSCYTDFHLATKINFLSGEAVTCSAKLGPITTEYFFRFREEVEAAPDAALIAVNGTAAEKLERRLERLGVTYERKDLMKPVLLRLSRKVDPEELFPGRSFAPR